MSFFDLVTTSLVNLYQRKGRTLLTILGVIIGTMSIVLMVALGEGSTQAFIDEISGSTDLTRIEVYQGYFGYAEKGGAGGGGNPSSQTALDDKTIAAFEALPNVKTVLPMAQVPVYLESSRYVGELYLSAVPLEKLKELYSKKLAWGSVTSSGQDYNLYLGASVSQWSFYFKQPGKSLWEMPQASGIDFEKEKFTVYLGSSWYYTSDESGLDPNIQLPKGNDGRVAGLFSETGGELDYAGYLDLALVQKFVKQNKAFAEAAGITANYTTVYVYATDMNAVADTLATIKEMGFQAYSPMEYIEQMQQESKRQQAQWGAVGAIALLVSAIGIVNTMMTSILERKREIGVLKVLGCSLGGISGMFLTEAAVIGMLGGAIGVLLSYGVAFLTTVMPVSTEGESFFGSFFSGNIRFLIRPVIAAAAVLGAALIGMLAGVYPSVRAMRMPALNALRDE